MKFVGGRGVRGGATIQPITGISENAIRGRLELSRPRQDLHGAKDGAGSPIQSITCVREVVP